MWPNPSSSTTSTFCSTRINRRATARDDSGELPEPLPIAKIGALLDRADGFERTPADLRDI